MAVTIRNIQVGQVSGVQEEHVLRLFYVLESGGVVWELVARIRCRGVAEEDALDLIGKVGGQFWVVAHDVAVAGVCH